MNWEFVGIAGTLFVLLSFIMTDIRKVRIINSIGGVLFVIYGIAIGAFSTWLLNGIVIIVNIIQLLKVRKPQ